MQSKKEDSETDRWQRTLLPLMSRCIVLVGVFFFTISFIQLAYLHYRISQPVENGKVGLEFLTEKAVGRNPASGENVASMPVEVAHLVLENYAIKQRYHQANVLLMARIWTRYLGFVTGMSLAIVGAVFILGKLESTETTVEGGWGQAKYVLSSASPGVILAAFGSLLMLSTIVVHNDIVVEDRPIYVEGSLAVTAHAEAPALNSLPEPQ